MTKTDIQAPPHAPEAEKAVLGAILCESDSINLIADKLKPEHFYKDAHQKIYAAMLDLYGDNETTDILTVNDRLSRGTENQSEYLGTGYLVELSESAPVALNIESYAKIIRERYYLRQIINACQVTMHKAMSYDGEIGGFVEDIEKEFLAISNTQDKTGLTLSSHVLHATIEDLERRLANDTGMTGVPTDFLELDRITGGWQPSDLIIVAARPGMGKTVFALNIMMNAVRKGKSVAMFTLEMSKVQLMTRVIAAEARVDGSQLRKGQLTDEQQDRLMHGVRSIAELENAAKLGIDETPGINIMELRSRCRRFKKEHGLDLIIVDYLQLMGPSGNKKVESREREISEISGGLKALAKELNVPVIALAQLNRGPDTRPDKVPKLADLRESGSMEQDADQILFLYRDEYYNPNSEDAGKAMVKVAKNRHGELAEVFLAFAPAFQKFSNLAHE